MSLMCSKCGNQHQNCDCDRRAPLASKLPPELFGIPGTPSEWLSPADEQKALERIAQIAGQETRINFLDSEERRYLCEIATKLIHARINTRDAIARMAQDLAQYENGQTLLGAVPSLKP